MKGRTYLAGLIHKIFYETEVDIRIVQLYSRSPTVEDETLLYFLESVMERPMVEYRLLHSF